MRKFTEQHEWVELENDIATVGITDFAQHQLGDVVYVELPVIGKEVSKGKEAAVVESVKAASEVYAPLSGEVVDINETLNASPHLVNEASETSAWFFKMRLNNPKEIESLMSADEYQKLIA
jgi:glycine cleavage system H protein